MSANEIEDLTRILQDALSSDKSVRNLAEERINELVETHGFLTSLTRYAQLNSQGISGSQRLMALTILKQKISKCTLEESMSIMNILLNILPWELDRHVVNLSAAIVSIIAVRLESNITTNANNPVYLNLFVKFITDSFTLPSSAVHIINSLLLVSELRSRITTSSTLLFENLVFLTPSLLHILVNGNQKEASFIVVFLVRDIFLSVLSMRKKNLLDFVKGTWNNFFPILLDIVQLPCLPLSGEEKNIFRNKVILEILSFFEDMIHAAKWTRKEINVNVVEKIINSIVMDDTVYFEFVENNDVESIIIQQVMTKRWNLLGEVARIKSLQNIFETIINFDPDKFLNLILMHTKLRDVDVEEWLNETNSFLRQEEENEDDGLWNVRTSAADVCRLCTPIFGGKIMEFLVNSLDSIGQLWKTRESILFVLEVLLRRCPQEMLSAGVNCHNQLLQILLKQDLVGPAVLATRALSVLGILLVLKKREGVNVESSCSLLLPKAVISLKSDVPLLGAAACKLLHRLLPLVNLNDALSLFAQGEDALFSLMLKDDTVDDMLYISIEVYTEWISKCHLQTKGISSTESHSVLFKCWIKHINDPNIGELVVSLFNELIIEFNGDESFFTQLSWITNILNGNCSMEEHFALPLVLQILACVFKKGSDNVALKTANFLIGSLCELLLTSEESSIVVSASNCLTASLQRCPQLGSVNVCVSSSLINIISSLRVNDSFCGILPPESTTLINGNESQVYPLSVLLVTIVINMLQRDKNEVTLMNSGKLLVAIVESTNGFRDDEISSIVIAIVTRLMTVRTETVAQELISPLAVLLKQHMHAFINLLLSSGLLIGMFSVWLPKVGVFLGKTDILRSCDALLDLLGQWPPDERLSGAMLPWSKGKNKKEMLPLDIALFIACGKGVLNLISQCSMSEEEEEESEDDLDWASNDDDDNNNERDEESTTDEGMDNEDGKGFGIAVGKIGPDVEAILQKVSPLVSHYGPAAAPLFTNAEIKELSLLFGTA
ncbi:hypothetical protein LSM04_007979 [Trypanosoma melophagium]|uniref:uncharacterized protein n=1 Tax=Trypanosoma melophagium TaxID=715481 RepID=UPI00351A0041|nr:hypothetical protein LSM04_007979 [Trypanosoma melophagium]